MATTTHLTFAEFEQLPDTESIRELMDGEVIEVPPAKKPHMRVALNIYNRALKVVDSARVWTETGYQMSERHYLIPDVSVSYPDQPEDNDYAQGAPLLAIEIASRGNTAEQLDRKVNLYLRHGAREVWVVYPLTRSMMVFRPDNAERITGRYESTAVPGLAIDIAEILTPQ
jgi:Uma2 family endonuclease